MKKLSMFVLAVTLIALLLPVHAMAATRPTDATCAIYPICEEDGCTTAGVHEHDGVTYCGYNNGYLATGVGRGAGNGLRDGSGRSMGGRGVGVCRVLPQS